MNEYSAEKAIERAIQICKYEPEFNFDYDTGMIQIWDYSSDFEQAFHREDYCKADQIDIDELIKLIDEDGFSYVSNLYDAYNYKEYRIECEIQYKGEESPEKIRAFALDPEIIQECVSQKNYEPLISYLENSEGKEVVSFIPSTPLEKAVMEGCNIYEVNVHVEGYIALEEDEDFDSGVLEDVDYESTGDENWESEEMEEEDSEPKYVNYHVVGCYTFEVAAKTEDEAYKEAQGVFDEHWDNGYVDCGDIENTDTIDRTSNYGGEKFCVVDSYTFKPCKNKEQDFSIDK